MNAKHRIAVAGVILGGVLGWTVPVHAQVLGGSLGGGLGGSGTLGGPLGSVSGTTQGSFNGSFDSTLDPMSTAAAKDTSGTPSDASQATSAASRKTAHDSKAISKAGSRKSRRDSDRHQAQSTQRPEDDDRSTTGDTGSNASLRDRAVTEPRMAASGDLAAQGFAQSPTAGGSSVGAAASQAANMNSTD